ncbi:ATP-binding cassette domain-containing protein, partial [Cutibacterium acnes]
AQRRATARFRTASRQGLDATLRTRRVKGVYTGTINASVGVFITALTVLAGWLTLAGRISVGELVTVVGLAQTLGPPLRALGVDTATMLATAHASGDRFCELRDSPAAWQIHPDDGARTTPGDGPVELHIPVRDFQLDVAGGTHVGVMAPQSVCDALAEAIDHGSETVLNGVPASRLNPAQRRRLVLVAPRSPELFDDTARANIVLDSQTTVARLNAVVDAAALDTVVAVLPRGLETEVGEGGRHVSGGQRQRLALARALLHSPDGLVLIDPTTSIDAVTTATIARKVRQLRAGRTTIIATTSPALLDQMDEVVLLDADGRQIARAPHRELLARDDYREMLS